MAAAGASRYSLWCSQSDWGDPPGCNANVDVSKPDHRTGRKRTPGVHPGNHCSRFWSDRHQIPLEQFQGLYGAPSAPRFLGNAPKPAISAGYGASAGAKQRCTGNGANVLIIRLNERPGRWWHTTATQEKRHRTNHSMEPMVQVQKRSRVSWRAVPIGPILCTVRFDLGVP